MRLKKYLGLLVGLILIAALAGCTGQAAVTGCPTPAEVTEAIKNVNALGTARVDAIKAKATSPECNTPGTTTTTTAKPDAPASTTTTTVPAAKCASTWAEQPTDKANNRWVATGIQEIKDARSDDEARKAAEVWLDKVKRDRVLLSGAGYILLRENVNKDELFDAEGCATPKAVELAQKLESALMMSRIVKEDAPANGHNTGATGERVGVNPKPGVTGDRTAVKVVQPDGTVVWVMYRCGQPVVVAPPEGLPEGPTDNPPEETPPASPPSPGNPPGTSPPGTNPPGTSPPGTNPPGNAKVPSRDPQPQGNNRPGGGGTAPPVRSRPSPPAAGSPPRTYAPPATPKPAPAPRPTVAPPATQAPPVTAPPATNTGTVKPR